MPTTRLAALVYRRLREAEPGVLLAAWDDGSVTLEALDFTGYTSDDGRTGVPLALFPTGQPLTLATILRELRTGHWRLRALPAPGRKRHRSVGAD